MSTNEGAQRERAERQIGEIASDQLRRLEEGVFTGREMILACRHILDLWVDSGGGSLDDEMVGVLGIESQCDHVMSHPGQRRLRLSELDPDQREEIEELGTFFRDAFAREMRELARRFGNG